jgi:hypothetical protein
MTISIAPLRFSAIDITPTFLTANLLPAILHLHVRRESPDKSNEKQHARRA